MPSQSETPAPVTTPESGARTEGRIERQPTPLPEPEREPAAEPARPTPTSEEPAAPVAAGPATIGGDYTVERNDTLWRIASRANPGSPSAVNQTMIALFRANPDAFNGNINRLRAGSVLRIPDMAEIEAVSTGEATTEVARQTAEWAGAAPTESVDEANRLRLVTPEETPVAPTAAAPATTPAEPAASQSGSTSGAPAQGDKRLQVTSPELAAAQQNVDETPAEAAPVEAEPSAEAPGSARPLKSRCARRVRRRSPPLNLPAPRSANALASSGGSPLFWACWSCSGWWSRSFAADASPSRRDRWILSGRSATSRRRKHVLRPLRRAPGIAPIRSWWKAPPPTRRGRVRRARADYCTSYRTRAHAASRADGAGRCVENCRRHAEQRNCGSLRSAGRSR